MPDTPSRDRQARRENPRTTTARPFDEREAAPGLNAKTEVDGQLGPDELDDPTEVIMNVEAKLHQH